MMTFLTYNIFYTYLWNKVVFLAMVMLLTSESLSSHSSSFIITKVFAKYLVGVRSKPMVV